MSPIGRITKGSIPPHIYKFTAAIARSFMSVKHRDA